MSNEDTPPSPPEEPETTEAPPEEDGAITLEVQDSTMGAEDDFGQEQQE